MSSNRVLAEKLKSAREVVGFLNKKTEENSMDEDMLSYVFNTLNDAVVELLFPPKTPVVLAPPSQTLEEQVIASTKIDLATKKAERKELIEQLKAIWVPKPEAQPEKKNNTTVWTAERRAAHSAQLKATWAAKKAQQPPATE